jgi:enterochelin esterase-like enzyme
VRLPSAFAAALAVAVAVVLAGIATAAVDRPARPAGPVTVLSRAYDSRSLRGRQRFAIALPPGYATSRRRFPVVYALHGLPGGATTFGSVPIARMAATAAAAGHPVVVVAPQGARSRNSDDEWLDRGAGRNWETAIASELVAYVDHHWRTISDRRSRAIIGTSAGGYGATILGLRHPQTFSVIESWSGYFRPTTPDGSATLHLGSAADDRAADAHSFVGCLAKLPEADRPRFIGFYVGAQDSYGDFIADNRRLHAELDAARVAHRFAVYPGGHDAGFWAAHERSWLLDGVTRLARASSGAAADARRAQAAARRAGCATA